MGVKTSNPGHFQIPTAPAAGVSCTSGAANAFTTTYVQLIASTAAALYITGLYVEEAAVSAATYISVQLATGGAGSEVIIGQYLIAPVTGSTVTRCYRPIFPPIPVAISTRIAVKTADSVGSAAKLITLECIAQANVVDDGIAITTVTTVTNQLTAAQIATGIWQDATAGDFTAANSVGKSVMNGVALGTGLTINGYTGNTPQTGDSFLVVKSGGTGDNAAIKAKTDNLPAAPASTTNITSATGITVSTNNDKTGYGLSAAAVQAIWDALTSALTTVGSIGKLLVTNIDAAITSRTKPADTQAAVTTVTTTTNLTNLPSIPNNWLTAAGIAASALNGKGDWNIGKTGYALSAAGVQAIWDALTSALTTVGSIGKLLVDNINATISSRSTYAGGDTAGTTTLLSRLTSGRATNLDNLDATTSSRLATAGYTAPDNADIVLIKAKTDNLPAAPAAASDCITAAGVRTAVGLASANLDTQLDALPTNAELTTALASADDATLLAVAGVQTTANAIKGKTDSLTFTVTGEVDANLCSINEVEVTGDGETGSEWGPV